jgi:hypothetical protein
VVGWVLAQGTALAKDFYVSWKLKRALVGELEDIMEQLKRVTTSYRRQLQVFALRGIEAALPIAIPNLFFKQYYKDVFHRLNREQRLSYQLIHGTIDRLNSENEQFLNFTRVLVEKLRHSKEQEEVERAVDLWGDRVMALFNTACDSMFYIDFHLKNQKRPVLDFKGPMHKGYLQFAEEVQRDIQNVMEGAKKLKREDFEKIYDERHFRGEGTEKS